MAVQNLDPHIARQLSQEGSNIATARETIPYEATVNDPSTGFIYAPNKQDNYNIPALKQAIDTNVTELIPPSEEQILDLVPRPLYEDALEALATAEQVIETQSATIAELESKISELEAQIETLSSDLDNEKLLRVVAEANAENLRQQLQLINESAQVALQRSVLEGIQRSTADATAEGLRAEVAALKDKALTLQAQIDSLNNILAGKDAQLQAGAESTTEMTVRVVSKPAPADNDVVFDCSITDANARAGGQWINGPDIEVYNADPKGVTQNITVDVTQCLADGQIWVFPVQSFSVPQGGTARFTLSANYVALDKVYPRTRTFTSARSYAGGKITIKANTTALSLSARVYKHKNG